MISVSDTRKSRKKAIFKEALNLIIILMDIFRSHFYRSSVLLENVSYFSHIYVSGYGVE